MSRRFGNLFDHLPLAVVVTDTAARIVYANATFCRDTGYTRAELLGENPRILQSGETPRQRFDELWQALTEGRGWHGELCNQRKDGEPYAESLYVAPIRGAGGATTHYLGIWLDVTADQRERRQLREAARVDGLTGILNRRGLAERIEAEVHRARRHRRPLAGMLVDIDDFKATNDRWGHVVGDTVLRRVAASITLCVRREDAVGRFGGDEFLVLMPDTEVPAARQVGLRILAAIRRLEPVPGAAGPRTSCSAGVGRLDGLDAQDLDQLLVRIDRLLYAAKAAGKDRLRSERCAAGSS